MKRGAGKFDGHLILKLLLQEPLCTQCRCVQAAKTVECRQTPELPEGFKNGYYKFVRIFEECPQKSKLAPFFPELKEVLCSGKGFDFDSGAVDGEAEPQEAGVSLGAVFGVAFVAAFAGVFLGFAAIVGVCCLWCRYGRPVPHRGPVYRLGSGTGGICSAPASQSTTTAAIDA